MPVFGEEKTANAKIPFHLITIIDGKCTESILPDGIEEIKVFWGGSCGVLGVTTSLVNRYASYEEVGNRDQYL
jgi:hypothetical protein